MRILLDTYVLIWAADGNLPRKAVPYFEDKANTLVFSPAGIWEIVIKIKFWCNILAQLFLLDNNS